MGKKLKNIGITLAKIIWVVFLMAQINNIISQVGSVQKAKVRNKDTEDEIKIIQEENIKLLENIRYATSSAFLEEAKRSYFGVGSINDVWLVLPDMTVSEEIPEKEKLANWRLWLELFTKTS